MDLSYLDNKMFNYKNNKIHESGEKSYRESEIKFNMSTTFENFTWKKTTM